MAPRGAKHGGARSRPQRSERRMRVRASREGFKGGAAERETNGEKVRVIDLEREGERCKRVRHGENKNVLKKKGKGKNKRVLMCTLPLKVWVVLPSLFSFF